MRKVNEIVREIESLFYRFGQQTYEENCTQLQHAEQSGTIALEHGMDEEFALAAFLHDIGHFLADDQELEGMTAFGYADHANLGADYLKECGFSERLVTIVREHVRAKRFLAATQDGYLESLSTASTETLKQQGGPMTGEELARYQRLDGLQEVILLRAFDDSGKQPEMPCKPLSYWMEAAVRLLDPKESRMSA